VKNIPGGWGKSISEMAKIKEACQRICRKTLQVFDWPIPGFRALLASRAE
jgi:hypothetical protein